MHTDVLHILNNDHTFGKTDGDRIGTTNSTQRWIFEKIVNKQTD